jgi:prepilin peptidase CpaA
MTNVALTQALLAILAILLVIAAIVDVRTYTISNRMNLAIAGLAPLFWWSAGLPLWPDVAAQIGIAVAVFFLLAMLFYAGMMGGGDVKLAAALALWFTPAETLRSLVYMALAGGLVTIIVLLIHRPKSKGDRARVPYGVAIAAGALVILTQRFLNQFA